MVKSPGKLAGPPCCKKVTDWLDIASKDREKSRSIPGVPAVECLVLNRRTAVVDQGCSSQ